MYKNENFVYKYRNEKKKFDQTLLVQSLPKQELYLIL